MILLILNKCDPQKEVSDVEGFPGVSLIVAAYNEEKVIERTIKSVLNTQYTKKEIIVIDNGSTDQSLKILKKYRNKIKIIRELKKGKSYAINKGILLSKGEIIVIMDADTVVADETIYMYIQLLQSSSKWTLAQISTWKFFLQWED